MICAPSYAWLWSEKPIPARAGFDGHKKHKGSKVHIAVDTLGHLLAIGVTPANEQDWAQVGQFLILLVKRRVLFFLRFDGFGLGVNLVSATITNVGKAILDFDATT